MPDCVGVPWRDELTDALSEELGVADWDALAVELSVTDALGDTLCDGL